MFDRLKFDQQNQNEWQRQLESLQKRLYDAIATHNSIKDAPISTEPTQEDLDYITNIPIPEIGRNALEIEEELVEYVFSKQTHLQHPRCFSFVCSSVSPYSIAGAILTDLYNPNAGSYTLSPGAGIIEEKMCTWMASYAGYPKETSSGIFMSGGSLSTMSAIMVARINKLDEKDYGNGVAYLSDQAHSSVRKALKLLGFRKDQIVILPSDDDFKMDVSLLEEAILQDKAKGLIPFLVVGTLGTTNTGTIDPLSDIGDIAQKYNMWFHVDGAYGGSSLISPIYRNYSKGIEKSDSLTWDTHKWLMQTYSCSTLLVKNKQTLLNAFVEHPEYLEDISSSEHIDGFDRGPEMSRPHRAIKLWFTVQAVGTNLLEEMIEYSFYNAQLVLKNLEQKDNWEIISKPSCGTINFRYAPEGFSNEQIDELNQRISQEIISSGYAYIVTTTLKGMKTIRMCMINANSTEEDILNTVEELDKIAKKLHEEFKQ